MKTMVPSCAARFRSSLPPSCFCIFFNFFLVPMAYFRNLSTLSANTTITIARKNSMTPRQTRL